MTISHRLLALAILFIATTAHSQTLLVAVDHSLTAAEYQARGVPDPGHAWSDVEVQRAMQALQKIADKDPLQLPRRDSQASGAIFARLVAPIPLPTDTTNLHARIADLSGYAQPLGGLPLLYAKPLAGDFFFDAELVEATRAALAVNAQLLQLINRERSQFTVKKTPTWLRHAHRQVAFGGAMTVRGALFIYAARRAFRPEWRAQLMVHLQQWVPALMLQLPETAHTDLLAHLHGLMQEDPPGYADWQELQQLMTFGGHGPAGFDKPRSPRKHRRHKK